MPKCLPSLMHHFRVQSMYQSQQLESGRCMITIENQLHIFEYFYNKMIYMENFCLGFVKVLPTH